MDTTKAFLRAKWNAPVIESGGFRQSRRLDDQLSCDGETEAYTGIVFYVEKGLSGRLSFLKQFVSNLRSIQSEIEGYFIHLLSFGFDDNVLHTLYCPLMPPAVYLALRLSMSPASSAVLAFTDIACGKGRRKIGKGKRFR